MSKSKEAAKSFVEAVRSQGWDIERVGETIVTISKSIVPNDNQSFAQADSEYYFILAKVPASGGSMWGTDGGGIGALSAMKSGRFVMNLSGVQSRFIKALNAIGW